MQFQTAQDELSFQYVPTGFSTFSVIRRVGGVWRQRSYSIDQLPHQIEHHSSIEDADVYITQHQFYRMNRQKLSVRNLCCLFQDLDFQNHPTLAKMSDQERVWYILWFCKEFDIPYPSVIMGSGQGVYLKWYLEWTPAKAMPLWDRVQLELLRKFEDLASDPMARDASRVLRIIGSTNQKSGGRVRVLWESNCNQNCEMDRYNINEFADIVLPYTRAEYRAWLKRKRAEREYILSSPAERKSYDPLIFEDILREQYSSRGRHMYEDHKTLFGLRGWGETGIPDGYRAAFLFWYGNHIALSFAHLDRARCYHEIAYDLRALMPSWKMNRIHNLLHSVYKRIRKVRQGQEWNRHCGRLYSAIYTPSNQRLIIDLRITDEEIIHLNYIQTPETHAAQKRRKRAETRNAVEERRSEALKLRLLGMTQKQIANQLNITVRTVQNYLNI